MAVFESPKLDLPSRYDLARAKERGVNSSPSGYAQYNTGYCWLPLLLGCADGLHLIPSSPTFIFPGAGFHACPH